MADTYSTTEARRKALRNGEEDPAVVAQRYLNIYRQMHIFPPERKEAFNKMLLELPPLVKNIIGTMPGGVMLQDYIDDLLQKNGMTSVERDETPAFNQEKSSEATIAKTNEGENAPVRAAPEVKAPETTARPIAAATLSLGENFAAEFAAALAKVQTASIQTPPVATQTETKAPVSSGTPTIEFGQGFAAEFSKQMASVLEKQNISQKESLEKLTGDLTKIQLFLAKNLKESQDEQKQSLNELVKNILAFYRQEREEQRQEIGQICKTLAQNQTALSLSMGNNAQTEISQEENSTAQKMMDLFLESQKQFNTRLDKIEATTMNVAASNKTVDETKLLKVIGDSQEKLIQTLTTLNLQNNTAQANNNANN
ncbi:MAG: hypothetical protein MJ210_03200, partial [Alphaproteobacteria bacterium]|nr:hypothetical protein [Alphaproteobacteria bacterium]